MSDADLVRQSLAGNVTAYEQLVRRWSPHVVAVCHSRLGRADAADDLAQETLLRGLRALPTLHAPEKFGSWLCGIASRACLDWLKSSQRSEVALSSLPARDSEQLDDGRAGNGAVERQEELGILMAEVQRLPVPYREVLMHYYYDDCTYQSLADLLGVSTATVNARLTKARQMLRERLGANRKSGHGE
jgi:RNA polymerase sigma factor (sigma-70 family)